MIDSGTFVKLVAEAIPAHPDTPRCAEDIAAMLAVPVGRVHRAIVRLKEDFPDLPLTSGANGYRWSRDPVDIKRHSVKEVKYITTRTRRSLLEGLLEPYYKTARPEELERARQRIEFILDDLARLSVNAS